MGWRSAVSVLYRVSNCLQLLECKWSYESKARKNFEKIWFVRLPSESPGKLSELIQRMQ